MRPAALLAPVVVGVLAHRIAAPAPAELPPPATQPAGETDALLIEGRLEEALERAMQRLARNPADDRARFEAAVVRFLAGVEQLTQDLYRFGFDPDPTVIAVANFLLGIRIVQIPLPENPDPDPASYDDARGILLRWNAALAGTFDLLEGLGDREVELKLHLGLIPLDFNADGVRGDDELLWRFYAELYADRWIDEHKARVFTIGLDRADAEWLRAYCHLLSALNEFLLAYDWRALFEHTGHLIFRCAQTRYDFLYRPAWRYDMRSFADLIALVHLLRAEAVEPDRMPRVLEHLIAVTGASRRMWRFALAETDDDREWIPNPDQHCVIPYIRVTQAQVRLWHELLDEVDAVLVGERLLPFWRERDGRGINLYRVLVEPRRFDAILWMQGSAAAPYLEQGPLMRRDLWWQLQRAFRGRFLTFAMWWN